jgi:hypothetical protein
LDTSRKNADATTQGEKRMIDRLILSAVLSVAGWNGLFPDSPAPMSLQAKAKYKSISNVCAKKKTKKVKQMCKRWEDHNA